jgi:hypothetical protein
MGHALAHKVEKLLLLSWIEYFLDFGDVQDYPFLNLILDCCHLFSKFLYPDRVTLLLKQIHQ